MIIRNKKSYFLLLSCRFWKDLTYTVLPFILILLFPCLPIFYRLLFEFLRELLNIEETGATHHILLQAVINELELVLNTQNRGKRVTGDQKGSDNKIVCQQSAVR